MEENMIKRAILVSVVKATAEVEEAERSLDELERLLDTAGGEATARVIQVKPTFDPRTVIGSGKVLEIKELAEAENAELVIFDFELSKEDRDLISNLKGVCGEAPDPDNILF